jgi:hypothetical protein
MRTLQHSARSRIGRRLAQIVAIAATSLPDAGAQTERASVKDEGWASLRPRR